MKRGGEGRGEGEATDRHHFNLPAARIWIDPSGPTIATSGTPGEPEFSGP